MSTNCRRCGIEIDAETCHCGAGKECGCDGHSFTPILCGCGEARVHDAPAVNPLKSDPCARCGHPWAEHRVHSRSCATCACKRFLKPGSVVTIGTLSDFAMLVVPKRCDACRRGASPSNPSRRSEHTFDLGCSMAHAHYCSLCDRTRACSLESCETWDDLMLDYGIKRAVDGWCDDCVVRMLSDVEKPDRAVLELVGDPIDEEGFDG